MEKGIRVKDIVERKQAEGIFLALDPRLGQGRNGAPYWSLKISDMTGSLDAKIWQPLSASIAAIESGSLIYVSGHASLYRDQLQFVIEKMQPLTSAELASLDMAEFMRTSPYNIEAMFAELQTLCQKEFNHPAWAKLVDEILGDQEVQARFKTYPAAKSIHHAYAGGLLEHTLSVARLCMHLADKYQHLDRQTLLAGAVLHDIGKIRELSGGMSPEYTQEGKLLGHIFLGIDIIARHLPNSGLEPDLAEHLRHLILSHHGELEFGAARLPQTGEAFALHYADNIDAKMAQCRNALEGVAASGFGAWQQSLNRSIFRAMQTPPPDVCPAATGTPQPETGGEVSFEAVNEMEYDEQAPLDEDPHFYADADIPAEASEAETDFMEFAPDMRKSKAANEESRPRHRVKTRTREAQCSLLLKA